MKTTQGEAYHHDVSQIDAEVVVELTHVCNNIPCGQKGQKSRNPFWLCFSSLSSSMSTFTSRLFLSTQGRSANCFLYASNDPQHIFNCPETAQLPELVAITLEIYTTSLECEHFPPHVVVKKHDCPLTTSMILHGRGSAS